MYEGLSIAALTTNPPEEEHMFREANEPKGVRILVIESLVAVCDESWRNCVPGYFIFEGRRYQPAHDITRDLCVRD